MVKYIKSSIFALVFAILCVNYAWATDFKVVMRANKGVEVALKKYQATIDVLNKRLHPHIFTLIPIVSLDEIAQKGLKSEFDFLFTNPSSYVEIEMNTGAKGLVTLNNKRAYTAQSEFGSVIFTHAKNTHIVSINDLADKTFMVVSKPAFGGWRVAWIEMLDQGFDPIKKLKSLEYTKSGKQQDVVKAVLDGRVDAGVVRTDLLERLEAKGEIDMRYLRILNNKDNRDFPFFLSTKLYPEWAFAAMQHVPSEVADQVAQVLKSISKDSVAAKKGNYIGFIPLKDYSSVKNIMKRLEVGPFAVQGQIK